MKIAVIGVGGVGGYFGGRLAQAGADVTFIARGSHLAAMQERGLTLESPNGDAHIQPIKAVLDAGEVGAVEAIIFAVKMRDTLAAAAAIEPLVRRGVSVFTFQNGIESAEQIGKIVGEKNVIPGTAMIAATIKQPAVISQTGTIARLTFGEPSGRASPRTDKFFALCKNARIDAVLSDRIEWEVWNKFVHLSSFAGLTSLTRGPIGPVLASPEARSLLEQALSEATQVASAYGIEFSADSVSERLRFLQGLPPETTSSMSKDLIAGRPLEIHGLSGVIVRFGAANGVPTPIHRFIAGVLSVHADGTGASG